MAAAVAVRVVSSKHSVQHADYSSRGDGVRTWQQQPSGASWRFELGRGALDWISLCLEKLQLIAMPSRRSAICSGGRGEARVMAFTFS